MNHEDLIDRFEYRDGELFYKKSEGPMKKGAKVGTKIEHGYIRTHIKRKPTLVHRIIFMMHHGYLPKVIDHVDRNRTNNCIENLREATVAQNLWNAKKPITNTTGVKGVWYDKARNKWYAEFKTNAKKNYVGRFDTLEEATTKLHEARENAQKEFARHE